MSQQRLNNIMVLHIHKDKTDQFNIIDVANEFAGYNENRLRKFDTFHTTDLSTQTKNMKSKSYRLINILFF